MGCFSWTCAKTHLPILAAPSWGHRPHATEVVVLTPDGVRLRGVYNGYGRVIGSSEDLELDSDALARGEVKLVLAAFYQDDPFPALDRSHREPGQGHFHSPRFIDRIYRAGGFPSNQAYCQAYGGDTAFRGGPDACRAEAALNARAAQRSA